MVADPRQRARPRRRRRGDGRRRPAARPGPRHDGRDLRRGPDEHALARSGRRDPRCHRRVLGVLPLRRRGDAGRHQHGARVPPQRHRRPLGAVRAVGAGRAGRPSDGRGDHAAARLGRPLQPDPGGARRCRDAARRHERGRPRAGDGRHGHRSAGEGRGDRSRARPPLVVGPAEGPSLPRLPTDHRVGPKARRPRDSRAEPRADVRRDHLARASRGRRHRGCRLDGAAARGPGPGHRTGLPDEAGQRVLR